MNKKNYNKTIMSDKALIEVRKFISFAGGVQKAADMIGVSRALIYYWLNQSSKITPQVAEKMEIISKGLIKKEIILQTEMDVNVHQEILIKESDKEISFYEYLKKYYIRPKLDGLDMSSDEFMRKIVHPDIARLFTEFDSVEDNEKETLVTSCVVIFGGVETFWCNLVNDFSRRSTYARPKFI